LIRATGQQRHAILLLLDFPGNADGHGKFEFNSGCNLTNPAVVSTPRGFQPGD
jgi:hypothetical protein